jgi:hypothetical protein
VQPIYFLKEKKVQQITIILQSQENLTKKKRKIIKMNICKVYRKLKFKIKINNNNKQYWMMKILKMN